MDPEIETKHTTAVEAAIDTIYRAMFPEAKGGFVSTVFGWATDCFTGNFRDYQAIDANYHDLEHTLQGALCMAKLLHGRHLARAEPVLPRRMFELGLTAILLHDTGYLKKKNDKEGTGAKYTSVHVTRSGEFAHELLTAKGFPPHEIKAVQNMIQCTGVDANLKTIPFQNQLEKIVGLALGTSDLLGQMAAKDYIEKLPVLYSEFEESAQYSSTKNFFSSAEDLKKKTPGFWDKYVVPKIHNDFESLFRFLNTPYPDGENVYLKRIERNLAKIRPATA